MYDLHAHLLPDVDDGPSDWGASLAMARRAVEAGIAVVAATPHVDDRYGYDLDELAARTAEARHHFEAAGVSLNVVAGAEIGYTRLVDLPDEALERLSLNGRGWLLVECPYTPVVQPFIEIVDSVQRRGWPVLLAHPERCAGLLGHPHQLEDLVTRGGRLQVTSGSLEGLFGRTVARFARELLERRLVHNIASDAHDPVHRPPHLSWPMRDGRPALDDGYLKAMIVDAPAAILAGEAVPARLSGESARRRRSWGRR
jgi:protein-tyrosine phosphatase